MNRPIVRRVAGLGRRYLPAWAKRRIRRALHVVLDKRAAFARSGMPAARAAFGAREYDKALAGVDRILRTRPNDPDALELASRIAVRQGRFTDASLYAVRRAERGNNPAHWSHARKLVGRTRETDSRWQPLTPFPSGSGGGGAEANGPVLYLAKESRPFLHNGFCTRSQETLRALTAAGQNVAGVTMPGFPGVIGVENAPTESTVAGVRYLHTLPNAGRVLRGLAHDEYVQLATRMLAGITARERPSLLHVTSGHRGFETALAGHAVARRAGLPWLYEVRSFFEATWTDDPRYAEQGEYYEHRFATETRMLHACDLVVTLSEPMRAEIVQRHGVDESRVRVVPNAVDTEVFAPRARDAALRRKLGLDGTQTLGYVSNLSHPREGQEVLIEAIARMRRRGSGRNVTALLVGDGQRREELERLAKRRGVADAVVFTGSVPFDEVGAYYAQIDLFVVPRVDDRAARMVSPMKPYEAMAMRVPLLVADLPALAEIVGSGRRAARGRTFAVGDPEGLAAEAGRLLDAPGERAALAETAAGWVAAERSWSAVAAAFADCYDELRLSGKRELTDALTKGRAC